MVVLARCRRSRISSFLSNHCPLWMEKTQEQREWTAVGFSGLFLVAEWSAEKLNPHLFLKNRRSYRVHCSMEKAPVKPSKLHSFCSWVSSIGDGQWMGRRVLPMAANGPPKDAMVMMLVDRSQSTSHSKSIQIKSQANPRVFLELLVNSSALGSAFFTVE